MTKLTKSAEIWTRSSPRSGAAAPSGWPLPSVRPLVGQLRELPRRWPRPERPLTVPR